MYRNSIDESVTYYDKDTPTNFIGGRSLKKAFKRLETAENSVKPMTITFLKQGLNTA